LQVALGVDDRSGRETLKELAELDDRPVRTFLY
jgi:hypothetical protein